MNDLFLKKYIESSLKIHSEIVKLLAISIKNMEDGKSKSVESAIFKAETLSETAVLIDRKLPVCTENPTAIKTVEKNISDAFRCEMYFSERGWFVLQMPLLLPRKHRGESQYLRLSLCPQVEKFFNARKIKKLDDCVIVFYHINEKNRNRRLWRDNDNYEVKLVTDILAVYLMVDDNPAVCDHYYCSRSGETDETHVYVLPRDELSVFLEMKDKGNLPSDEKPLCSKDNSPTLLKAQTNPGGDDK